MHSAGLKLTKLTNTRLEDDLIRHSGDHLVHVIPGIHLQDSPSQQSVGCALVGLGEAKRVTQGLCKVYTPP